MTVDWKPDNESQFERFFNSLASPQAGSSNLFRIFDRGDYYTCHGDEALFVADSVFKTRTVLKYFSSGNLPYVTLTKLSGESLMRDLLLNKQHKVEMYVQAAAAGSWKVDKRGSPGNLQEFEDLLFDEMGGGGGGSDFIVSPIVMALKLSLGSAGQRIVGVAFIDAADRSMGLVELQDTDLFSNLESLIIQLSVKECLFPTDVESSTVAYDFEKMRQVLTRCDVVITNKPYVDCGDGMPELQALIKDPAQNIPANIADYPCAVSAMSWLVDHLDLMSEGGYRNQFTFRIHTHSQFMRLDSSAIKALHLTHTSAMGSNKSMSLYGLLDQCITAQGSRLLYQYLRQPLIDYDELCKRQDFVAILFDNIAACADIQNVHLKNTPDLSKLTKKFYRKKAGLKEVVRFYEASLKLPGLVDCLTSLFSIVVDEEFTGPLAEVSRDLVKFVELVENTVDLKAVEYHEYRIKAEYNQGLEEIKSRLDDIVSRIGRLSKEAASDLGLEYEKKLKLERNTAYGFHLRISRLDANSLRGKRGYLELSTLKSGITLTTVEIKKLSEEWHDLNLEYEKQQRQLVTEVIQVFSSYCPLMDVMSDLISRLDVLSSLAKVAYGSPIPYVRPKLHRSGTGNLILKDSRHPCVELQDGVNFIQNSVEMNRGESEFLVITGPNMGGKSTFIRQVGCIVLLAQIGSFVPCSHAEIPIFDSILARFGAGDAQLKGVSTFMMEMLEAATILKTATPNSLVITDEIGRGTATYDGFGLAWAICEKLAGQIGCFGLFATHFHEITTIAKEINTVKNVHVSAMVSADGITLLYKVQDGATDQSFGIHVAEIAKFPREVIDLAKKKMFELEEKRHDPQYDPSTVEAVMKKLASIEKESELEQYLEDLQY